MGKEHTCLRIGDGRRVGCDLNIGEVGLLVLEVLVVQEWVCGVWSCSRSSCGR